MKASESQTYYLRCDVLQPADVLLTLSPAWHSQVVRAATHGPYSHAAIVLDNAYLFEALEEGISFTPIRYMRCERGSHCIRVLGDLSSYREFVVLRLPELGTDQAWSLAPLLRSAVIEYLGLQYPNLDALRFAVTDIELLQAIHGFLLHGINRTRKEKVLLPGPFCSMLVGLVYEKLGLKLFDRERDPSRISPNRLLRSRLKPVASAICTSDPSARNFGELVDELNSMHVVRDGKVLFKIMHEAKLAGLTTENYVKGYVRLADVFSPLFASLSPVSEP